MDLVEVSPNSKPPVCRLMDFGKFKYEQAKKEKENKKKQTFVRLKEMVFSPKIEKHDFEVKKNRIEQFIEKGNKVKVAMLFRGRQIVHLDVGRAVLDRLRDELGDKVVVEREPRLEGRRMIMILAPGKSKPAKKS